MPEAGSTSDLSPLKCLEEWDLGAFKKSFLTDMAKNKKKAGGRQSK